MTRSTSFPTSTTKRRLQPRRNLGLRKSAQAKKRLSGKQPKSRKKRATNNNEEN
ncbi:hypothetical protein L917_04083, partial [Phytophthora nicotianae]